MSLTFICVVVLLDLFISSFLYRGIASSNWGGWESWCSFTTFLLAGSGRVGRCYLFLGIFATDVYLTCHTPRPRWPTYPGFPCDHFFTVDVLPVPVQGGFLEFVLYRQNYVEVV